MNSKIQQAAIALTKARSTIALTGAGISVGLIEAYGITFT
jgi:NAD-dependent SIR2 family protein deacetylase